MTLPIQIKKWLNERGITDAAAEANHLNWNGTQIIIPIFDPTGKFLFNKYRRDPYGPTDIPKYKYEAGTTAQLFNAHKIALAPFIIICEGEMDAIRLEVEGITAVSSTGGAGTFKEAWLPMFVGKEVYICFDDDSAGLKGAVKLLTKIPAKLIHLTRNKEIKDITDFLQKRGGLEFSFLINQAESYPILCEPLPEFHSIKDVENQKKKYKIEIENLVLEVRKSKNSSRPYKHLNYIISLLMIALHNLEYKINKIRYAKKPVDSVQGKITEKDIQHAKGILIETIYAGELYIMGKRGTGICPFHNERTGSFTIYLDQNKFYCFGCGAGNDVIDFVMKRDNCDFITAVKKLLNK